MEELRHSGEELSSLIASLRAAIQSDLLSLLMHYFCCFEAFMMETEKPRSAEVCFPSLHSLLSYQNEADFCEVMKEEEKRDLLLDDCYCLVAFLKERQKQLEKETHSVVICKNAEIAGMHLVFPLTHRCNREDYQRGRLCWNRVS